MIDFNVLNIGDTFSTQEGTMIVTNKIYDENGNLAGVSYRPAGE